MPVVRDERSYLAWIGAGFWDPIGSVQHAVGEIGRVPKILLQTGLAFAGLGAGFYAGSKIRERFGMNAPGDETELYNAVGKMGKGLAAVSLGAVAGGVGVIAARNQARLRAAAKVETVGQRRRARR